MRRCWNKACAAVLKHIVSLVRIVLMLMLEVRLMCLSIEDGAECFLVFLRCISSWSVIWSS